MQIFNSKSFFNPSFGELFPTNQNRIPDPSQENYAKYLETYKEVSWVHSCVNRIAQDIAAAPIQLFDRNDKVVFNHPALELLERVNNFMTKYDLFEWTQASIELTGDAYWYLDDFGGRGIPKTIFPLISSLVKIVPSKDKNIYISGYIYNIDGENIELPANQVIHFKSFNPTSYFYGLATIAAARIGIDSFNASGKWNLKFFDNSARPDIVMTTPHALKPEQRERMRISWSQKYGGEDKSHGVAFLEKGTKAEIISVNQKDMDFIQQKKMDREDICSTFGVPPALVGLFEYSNYANSEEQEKIYWRSTLIPKLTKFIGMLNEFYLPLFANTQGHYFKLVESEIKALRADEEKRSIYVTRYFQMGIPMDTLIDSYDLPFQKIKGVTNISYLPISLIPSGSQEVIEKSLPFIPKEYEKQFIESEKARTTPTRGQLLAKHQRFILLANILEKPFKSTIVKYFDSQKKIIVDKIRNLRGVNPTMLNLGINIQIWNKMLKEDMKPHIKRSVYEGRDSENLMLDDFLGKTSPNNDKKNTERINNWIELNSFTWAEQINQATIKKLDNVLSAGVSEGESIEAIADNVAAVFNTAKDYRSIRIAQTEIISALNQGSLEAYADNEMVEKKGWLPAYDEATRDSHIDAGNRYGVRGAIPLDEDFVLSSGATGPAPGQTGVAAEDINCRCTIFPVTVKR